VTEPSANRLNSLIRLPLCHDRTPPNSAKFRFSPQFGFSCPHAGHSA
jgi:hypothetical protein